MTLFALYGYYTRDLLTYQGRPITHTNRDEMEWIFPPEKIGQPRVVAVTAEDLRKRSPLPPLPLPEHPDLGQLGISWPLKREEWRR